MITADMLRSFTAVASDDPVKTDLELTCLACGEVVCDVEADDALDILVGVAEDHWLAHGHGVRDPRQVAQELAEFDRANALAALEGPTDPTGIDCWEAHESAGDQG